MADERMRIASNGNIGIGTTNPVSRVTINKYDGAANLEDCPLTVTSQIATSATILNDPKTVLYLGRVGTTGVTYPSSVAFKLCRYENVLSYSRTRLDIVLTHDFGTEAPAAMSIASNGNIGIGTNNPQRPLHVITAMRIGGSGACLDFGDDNLNAIYKNGTTAELRFCTSGADRIRIASNGAVGIQGSSTTESYFINNNLMASGTLTIGNITQNYGGFTNVSSNMGCICLECLDNTEIIIHDSLNGSFSFMRYVTSGQITIGRNMLSGVSSVFKGNNGTTWDVTSDHRIKENIKKANLNICYDNVKNINLYRFNYKDAFGNGKHRDRTQLGFVAQQVNQYYPKSITRGKRKLDDNREVPDLASIDVSQVNFTLFGAVKQLIRVVEKQSNRIKKLEEMLDIVEDGTVEDDADEPYVKIVCEGEVDIDTIVPSEPEETPENTSGSNSSNSSNVF
jgi:hypothetical protein